MAMTQLALIFMAGLATLLSGAGLLGPFPDEETKVVMSFAGAIVWGGVGISSFDVIVFSSAYASQSEPIYPLVYLGFGLAVIVALFSFLKLLKLVQGEVESTTEESIMP